MATWRQTVSAARRSACRWRGAACSRAGETAERRGGLGRHLGETTLGCVGDSSTGGHVCPVANGRIYLDRAHLRSMRAPLLQPNYDPGVGASRTVVRKTSQKIGPEWSRRTAARHLPSFLPTYLVSTYLPMCQPGTGRLVGHGPSSAHLSARSRVGGGDRYSRPRRAHFLATALLPVEPPT